MKLDKSAIYTALIAGAITGVCTGAIAVGARARQQDHHERRIESLENDAAGVAPRLAVIETDVRWIRHELERRRASGTK